MKKFRTMMVGLCLALSLAVSAQTKTTILRLHQEDFSRLNPAFVPTGILIDKAIPITPFSDSIKSIRGNLNSWDQLYYQLTTADLFNTMESLDSIAQKRREVYDKNNAAPLLIFDYSYNTINPMAIDSGLILEDENGYLKEAPNPSSEIPLYNSQCYSYMAAGTYSFPSETARILVTRSFLYTNIYDYGKQIFINRGDGNGFIAVPWETVVEISQQEADKVAWQLDYSAAGTGPHPPLDLKYGEIFKPGYKTEFSDKTIEFSSSLAFNGNIGKGKMDIAYGKDADGVKHTCLKKPFVIVEGIDFGYRNHRTGFYGEGRPKYKYGTLGFCDLNHGDGFGFNMEENRWSDAVPVFKEGKNLITQLNDMGYDVIYLDFYDGATFMEINSMVLVELINRINAEKCSNEEIVIMGPSMGGQIAKFTLSYMEHNNMKHCVREFISFDSQYKGAHIPLALQSIIATMDLSSSLKDMYENILLRPATRQFLIQQYVEMQTNAVQLDDKLFRNSKKIMLNDYATNTHRNNFLANLEAVGGYPKQCRLVAICNGNASGTGFPDLASGNDLFDIQLSAPIIGAINILAVLGRGTTMHSLGAGVDIPNVIYGIRFYNKLFKRTYKELFITVPHTMGVLDDVPSSSRNDLSMIKQQVTQVDGAAMVNVFGHSLLGFCPSVSTLDFNTNNWKENIFYKDQNNQIPSIFRPFEEYYAHPDNSPLPFTNEPHVWISRFGKYGANLGEVMVNNQLKNMEGNADWGMKQTLINEDMVKGQLPNTNPFTMTTLNYVNLAHLSRRTITEMEINKNGKLQINGNKPYTKINYIIETNHSDWKLTQGRFEFNTSTLPHSGSQFEVSTCNCESPVVTINSEGEIEVGDENAEYPINNKGILRIRKGAKLIINNGGILLVHPGSRVIIEEGAELVYYPGALIILQGTEAILEIQGIVKIENGAIFNFSQGLSNESGYILCENINNNTSAKFCSSTTGSIHLKAIPAGMHLLTTKGVIIVDESISSLTLENVTVESTDNGRLECRNSNVSIKNGVFMSTTGSRSSSHGLRTMGQNNVTVQNTKFKLLAIGYATVNTLKNMAIPNIINCIFDNCSEGLVSNGMSLNLIGSTFKNSGIGLSAILVLPSFIKNNTFLKNNTGIFFSSNTTTCHLEGNTFSSCGSGIQTQPDASGNYSLKCNSFNNNTIAGINASGGAFSLSPNKGYNGYYGGANTFNLNTTGILLNATEIYLDGGYNNFITSASNLSGSLVKGLVLESQITNGNELSAGGNYWMPAPGSGNLKNGNGLLYSLSCNYAGPHLGIAYLAGVVQSVVNTACYTPIDQNDQLNNNNTNTVISNLTVTPNPVSVAAMVMFDYLPLNGVTATVRILNASGTVLQTISPLNIINGSNLFAINLTSYTSGIYYIEIILPTTVLHYSVMKY